MNQFQRDRRRGLNEKEQVCIFVQEGRGETTKKSKVKNKRREKEDKKERSVFQPRYKSPVAKEKIFLNRYF